MKSIVFATIYKAYNVIILYCCGKVLKRRRFYLVAFFYMNFEKAWIPHQSPLLKNKCIEKIIW